MSVVFIALYHLNVLIPPSLCYHLPFRTKEPVLRPGRGTFLHPIPDTVYGEGLPPHMQAITPSSPVPHDQQTEY